MRVRRMRLIAIGWAVAAFAGIAHSQDWDRCTGRNGPTFDQRIAACTAIIDSENTTPNDRAEGFSNRGIAYVNNGDKLHAIKDYEESLLLDPTSSSSHRIRGNKYRAEGDLEKAITEFSEAIRLNPSDARAFGNRAGVYLEKKDYIRAMGDYDEAVRLDPQWSIFFAGRANARRALGANAAAIVDYTEAIRLDSNSAFAFYGRAAAYHANKDYDHAIADYSEAIRLNYKSTNIYLYRAFSYHLKGDYQRAVSDYDHAIRINPQSNVAFRNRGFARLKLGLVAQAASDFDIAIARDAKDSWSLYGRGITKWKESDAPGAQADIERAQKSRSDIAQAVAKNYGVRSDSGLSYRLARAYQRKNPITFVLVQGKAEACGPNCNEWIAADGQFDLEAASRFRDFISTLNRRKPPIFFNSRGGSIEQSFAIGRLLRARKIAASVGLTIPDNCNRISDPSCQEVIRSGRPFTAQLHTRGAVCHSACVYALMGAPVRQIMPDALLGIHAPVIPDQPTRAGRATSEEFYRNARRRYAKEMGIDPEFVDAADKVPFLDLHILSRDEIIRFRIETSQH
jgi:tetratricopeptide (TPR) repeat protein